MKPHSCLILVLLVIATSTHAQDIGGNEGDGQSAGPKDATSRDQYRLMGPIRARDMTPFGILVLDMAPPYAVQDVERGWAVEVNFQTANNWLPSANAIEYLEGRPEKRAPLSLGDVDALLALEEDVFFADAAVQLIAPTFHYAWSKAWAAYLTLPVLLYNGGFTDGSVESFHKQFGFSSQGRELTAQDEFAVVVNLQGEAVSVLGAPTNGGFSDPVVGVRRSFTRGKWGFAAEGAVKIPVANEGKLLSSGSADFGLQFMAQRQIQRHGFSLALNHVWVGEYDLIKEVRSDSLPAALAAWEWGVARRGSLIVQLYIRESVIEKSTDPDITSKKIQATLGWRVRGRRALYSFAFTENLQTMNNTPDIGAHFSATWLSGGVR